MQLSGPRKYTLRKLLIGGILSFLLLPYAFATSDSTAKKVPPEKLLKKANKFYKKLDYQQALDNYIEYGQTTKTDNPEIFYKVGVCYFQLDEFHHAQKFLKKVSESNWKEYPYEYLFYTARSNHILHDFNVSFRFYEHYLRMFNMHHDEDKKFAAKAEELVYTAVYGKYYDLADTLIPVKVALEKLMASALLGKAFTESEKKVEVKKLPKQVNSVYDDYAPVISPDGKMLIFASTRPMDSTEEVIEEFLTENIFFSLMNENGDWFEATPFQISHEKEVNLAPLSFAPDNSGLYLFESKSTTAGNIYFAELDGYSLSNPKELPAPVNSEYFEPSCYTTSDGQTIYFSSNRPGGFGGLDLYRSTKVNDSTWGPAENLGPEINTIFDEDAPYISPSGKTLYFSSRGHLGIGAFDIYKVELEDSYSFGSVEVENMGMPVNTAEDDIFFAWTSHGAKGYFTSESDYNDHFNKDIFEMDLTSVPLEIEAMVKLTPESYPQPLDSFQICIYEAPEGRLYGCVSGDKDSYVLFYVQPNRNYEIFLENEKYGSQSQKYKADPQFDLDQTLSLAMVLDGVNIVEEPEEEEVVEIAEPDTSANIKVYYQGSYYHRREVLPIKAHFVFNESKNITDYSKARLDKLVAFLQEEPRLRVEVRAHADLVGDSETNRRISAERAQTVIEYLVSKGVDRERLVYFAHGEEDPLIVTENKEVLNRRVEFVVYSM